MAPPAWVWGDDLRHVAKDVVHDVSYAGSAMRGEILGVERRRFWRDEDKLEIVMSVGIDGATVTQVAQRHEITRQQIYAWRHDLKKKGLWSPDAGALFFPLDIPVTAGVPVAQSRVADVPRPSAVELRLRGGRSLHFDSTIDPTALSVLIRAVDAA
ncbi:Transposase [Puniceibacterium sp. IMCC21224]|nr:Transposase [Puniceibacterium sp. IMCC21224]